MWVAELAYFLTWDACKAMFTLQVISYNIYLDISYTCLTTHLKGDTSKTQAIVFSQNEKKSSFFFLVVSFSFFLDLLEALMVVFWMLNYSSKLIR